MPRTPESNSDPDPVWWWLAPLLLMALILVAAHVSRPPP